MGKHDWIWRPLTIASILWLGQLLLGPHVARVDGQTTQPTAAVELRPGQRQLFLDDLIVQEMAGLKRVMHQPVRRGAVVKPDTPSDGTLIQIRSSPMWDPVEQVYKLIYIAYTYDDLSQMGMAMATSKDGLLWSKPDLGQGIKVYGTTKNNRIQVDPSLKWPANCLEATVVDPDDADASRRFKGLLGVIPRVPVVSADGIQWRKVGTPPIPSSDEASLTYDRAEHRFIACLKAGNKFGRAFTVAFSDRFVDWTAPRFLFGADEQDQKLAPDVIRKRLNDPGLTRPLFVDPDPASGWLPPKDQPHIPTWRMECYYITVFPYEGVYIGLPSMYHPTGQGLPDRRNTDGFDLIQLAMTRDLEHWQRLGDREPFIAPGRIEGGRAGVWDRIQMFATNPIVKEDELWFYYSGLKWRDNPYARNADGTKRDPGTLTPPEREDQAEGAGAVCLAVLRRDGFISLDAAQQPGRLLTRPFKIDGNELYFNVDVKEGGSMRFDVLDDRDQVIPGFSSDEVVPIKAGGVRIRPAWTTGMDWNMLEGRTVRLRIEMTNSSLYGFWTDRGAPPAP